MKWKSERLSSFSREKSPDRWCDRRRKQYIEYQCTDRRKCSREAAAGDEVISGCINLTGLLKIRTTKEFGESTVSKILDLVENSSSKKSRSENFISKFARYYTPAVCYGALALAILPPLVRMFAFALAPEWGDWIYRALTFLVISCPCALVISIRSASLQESAEQVMKVFW